MGTDDAAAKVEELSALFDAGRLRDHGVPEEDLPEVAELSAGRPATQANPRPVSAEDALGAPAQRLVAPKHDTGGERTCPRTDAS